MSIHGYFLDVHNHREKYAVLRARALCIGCVLVVVASIRPASGQSVVDQVDERLRNRIESAGYPATLAVRGERIYSEVALPGFYERRAYRPAWVSESGPLPHADALVKMIREADREGLRPRDYHLKQLESMMKEMELYWQEEDRRQVETLTELDLLLTDAFLIYGSHLLVGRINPVTIDTEWHANRRDADLTTVLQQAVESDRVAEALRHFLPPQPGYLRLRQALLNYRALAQAGGWPLVPDGNKMQMGDSGDRIKTLWERLVVTGDASDGEGLGQGVFDEILDQAVRRFQKRHGLDVDGVVGRRTLEALNVLVEERLTQIELNMERWRWLPQDLGTRHILINIANFELDVVEGGATVLTMRVVVGRDYRRTPVFSDKMTYLVFDPYWNIPLNIAVEDIVPLIREDPEYLAKQKIKILQGWGDDVREIEPESVDWLQPLAENFSYRFRQEPGPENALGRIKFMFPNKFNVYLHDTPARDLFNKSERTLSSGCIRIEKAIELAEYVLGGDTRWNRERILAAIHKNMEQTVQLPQPVPIHLLYWTAWVDEEEAVHFRKDIYGRDAVLGEALKNASP